MSSFPGIVSEIANVSIDRFDKDNLNSTAFFLSHCHQDHMVGLQDHSFVQYLMNHDNIYLYCSEISYLILMNMNLQCIKNKIKIVTMQGPIIVHVPPSSHCSVAQDITVSAVPAGHCPGSVMFLLEYYTGRVLYTGDIRIIRGDIKKLKPLLFDDGSVKQIDTLYLDTTFLDPKYNYFPIRKESGSVLCHLIQDWILKSPRHYVYLNTPAKYGSEYLFIEIFKNLNTKVHVTPEYFKTYENVAEVECALTVNPQETRIHSCFRGSRSWNKSCSEDNLPCMYSSFPIRYIKASAMWFKSSSKAEKNIWFCSGKQCKVAYSCHSSFDELIDIITSLNPKKIVPCVVPPNVEKSQVYEVLNSVLQMKNAEDNDPDSTSPSNAIGLKKIHTLLKRSADSRPSTSTHDDLSSPPQIRRCRNDKK